jgi:hypothetical protein
VLTNQLARHAPQAYVHLTGQTGRGSEPQSPEEIANYFLDCFDDYRARLDKVGLSLEDVIRGNEVLEYGPGDVPGVALLMYAHGAAAVSCADRFRLVNPSEKNCRVLGCLVEGLAPAARQRARHVFRFDGRPESGLREEAISYRVTGDGLVHERQRYALAYSRAVLEHVNDLAGTFGDMWSALRPGGVGVHEVDLKSHGLHRDTPLDFLCWPERAWRLMHSNKGFPNRWRVDAYRRQIVTYGFEQLLLEPIELADAASITAVRPRLAHQFRELGEEDLSWLSFWMILRRPS